MDSRENNIQFRSVPLIQRGDMTRFGTASPAERVDATQRRRTPVEREDWSDALEMPSFHDEPRRKRRSSDETHGSGTTRRRSRLGANATPEFGASRLPAGQHVSAHMGESGVVSVSRRSDRRGEPSLASSAPATSRRSGLRLADVSRDDMRPEPTRSLRDNRRNTAYLESYEDDYEGDYEDDAPSVFAQRRNAVLEGAAAIPQAVASGVLGLFSHVRPGGLAVLVVAALTVIMLYGPARDLYVTSRKLEELQTTYEELLAENEQIKGELELLQTREGIENEARARGFVEPGEVKVQVNGLPEEEAFDGGAAAVAEPEYVDNRAWYVRVFDTLFAYEPEG